LNVFSFHLFHFCFSSSQYGGYNFYDLTFSVQGIYVWLRAFIVENPSIFYEYPQPIEVYSNGVMLDLDALATRVIPLTDLGQTSTYDDELNKYTADGQLALSAELLSADDEVDYSLLGSFLHTVYYYDEHCSSSLEPKENKGKVYEALEKIGTCIPSKTDSISTYTTTTDSSVIIATLASDQCEIEVASKGAVMKTSKFKTRITNTKDVCIKNTGAVFFALESGEAGSYAHGFVGTDGCPTDSTVTSTYQKRNVRIREYSNSIGVRDCAFEAYGQPHVKLYTMDECYR
jgi:hypothetical protein